MEMARLSTGEMLSGNDIDANANRERTRQKRLKKWLVILGFVFAYLLWRLVNDNPIRLGIPGWLMGNPEIIIALGLIVILGTVLFVRMPAGGAAGRAGRAPRARHCSGRRRARRRPATAERAPAR